MSNQNTTNLFELEPIHTYFSDEAAKDGYAVSLSDMFPDFGTQQGIRFPVYATNEVWKLVEMGIESNDWVVWDIYTMLRSYMMQYLRKHGTLTTGDEFNMSVVIAGICPEKPRHEKKNTLWLTVVFSVDSQGNAIFHLKKYVG